jgi:heme oxygenase
MSKAAQLHALASAANDAHRSLEQCIMHVDTAWSDSTRRAFEADHLAAIRADARHLRTELADIAAGVDKAIRAIDHA